MPSLGSETLRSRLRETRFDREDTKVVTSLERTLQHSQSL